MTTFNYHLINCFLTYLLTKHILDSYVHIALKLNFTRQAISTDLTIFTFSATSSVTYEDVV